MNEWKVLNITQRLLDTFKALKEPNESLLNVSMWNTILPHETKRIQFFYAFGLTDANLYLLQLNGLLGSTQVVQNRARPLGTLVDTNLVRCKDNKGKLLGHQMLIPEGFGFGKGDYRSPVAYSEPFREKFEIVITRYRTLNSSLDVAGQLSAMHQLWTEGVLSDEEFEKSKALFLGRSPDQQQVAENNLRSLKQLKDSGILSEAEFAAKKWEILSS